jgi:hypothetical protein
MRCSGIGVLLCCAVIVLVSGGILSSCELGETVYGAVFMTDSINGRVYTYDPYTQTPSSLALFTTNEGASDRIYFHGDIGYIATGKSFSNQNPGVYRFDPDAATIVPELIGASISAQYIAFFGDTRAYVTDVDFFGGTTGIYTFDPSNPAGLTGPIDSGDINGAAAGMGLQDIAVQNGKVYAADTKNGQVLVIDPATDQLVGTIDASSFGTTGLLPVTGSSGKELLYVVNNGLDSSWTQHPGSIDVIDTDTDILTQAVVNIYASLAAYHAPSRTIYAIGFSNTYRIRVEGAAPFSFTEMKDGGGASFGGSSISVDGDLLYITNTNFGSNTSLLFVYDAESGEPMDYSPVSVGRDGEDAITGLAVRP